MTDTPDDVTAVDEAAEVDDAALRGDVPGRDGGPIDPDDMRAADGLRAPEGTAEAYEDALEKGREQRGEGRVS